MTMTAEDVKSALLRHYPPAEYLHLYEVPQTSDRQGRKIDLLLISLWQSRGLTRHAIEIKVSYSDWKRELENPAKADWWYHHSHWFSVAAPAELAQRILPELPPTWGLLSVTPEKVHQAVKVSIQRDPEALTWSQTVGALRAAVGTSTAMLAHEYERGRAAASKRPAPDLLHAKVEQDAQRYHQLRGKVRQFERITGVDIEDELGPQQMLDFLATMRFVENNRQRAAESLRHYAERIASAAAHLEHRAWDEIAQQAPPEAV